MFASAYTHAHEKIVALIALMLVGVGIAKAAPNGVSVEITLDQDQFVPAKNW